MATDTHGWAETRDRCPRDGLLRRHGFKIEYRPIRGEALWSRNGVMYTEVAAVTEALRETESVATRKK